MSESCGADDDGAEVRAGEGEKLWSSHTCRYRAPLNFTETAALMGKCIGGDGEGEERSFDATLLDTMVCMGKTVCPFVTLYLADSMLMVPSGP